MYIFTLSYQLLDYQQESSLIVHMNLEHFLGENQPLV
jgi:hypothetical protein